MPESTLPIGSDEFLDGETRSSCQMWPTNMWPVLMWPLRQWPYCIIYVVPIPYACVVTLCCTALLSTTSSSLELKQIATVSDLNLVGLAELSGDLINFTNQTIDLLQTYEAVCDLLFTPRNEIDLISLANHATDLDNVAVLITPLTYDVEVDFVFVSSIQGDLISITTSDTDYYTVYEIEGSLCGIGGSCHVC